jgi:hypothetical protein
MYIYQNIKVNSAMQSVKDSARNWIYTSSNANSYILFISIVLLVILILMMGWYRSKSDSSPGTINKFADVTQPPPPQTTKSAVDALFLNSNNAEIIAAVTPTLPNYKISYQDREKWIKVMQNMDSNAGTAINPADTSNVMINQRDSSLYGSPDFVASYDNAGNSVTANVALSAYNGAALADYATIDGLGKSLTDSLGGINTNNGFAVLSEVLGTSQQTALKTYDNTQDYRTRMLPDATAGNNGDVAATVSMPTNAGKYNKVLGSPLFLQKDFEGVANIFAPNIYIANPPLDEQGNPVVHINFTDNSQNGIATQTTKQAPQAATLQKI